MKASITDKVKGKKDIDEGDPENKQAAMVQTETIRGQKFFNGEELLFLNRVAFMILAENGPDIKFHVFI